MSVIITALKKTLEADPSNWQNRRALVEAYLQEGRRSEARMLLNEIEALPEDEESLIEAAQSWAVAGSPEDGRRILQSVLDSNPASAPAHLALAGIAHRDGDSRTAMRHYITATSLDPSLDEPELEGAYGDLVGGTPQPSPPAESPEVPEPTPETLPESPPSPIEPTVEFQAGEETEEEQVAESTESDAPPETEMGPDPAAVSPVSPVSSMADAGGNAEIGVPDPERHVEESIESEESPDLETTNPGAALAEDSPELPPRSGDGQGDREPEADDDALHLQEDIKNRQEELKDLRQRQLSRDKVTSLTLTVFIHVGLVLLLAFAIVKVPRNVPPQIVASAGPELPDDELESETMKKPQVRPTSSASSAVSDVLSISGISSISISDVQFDGDSTGPSMSEMDFQPSMSFGSAASSSESMMMFGEKIEGEVLGVILDVSGSMAEYLPLVIREVDRNLKNAPIVYVNHAGILGKTDVSRVYPVVKEEVLPRWPRDWGKGNSPYWFLWGDLPRKAPQISVDRLIETFKTRPNMFIVRGGNNRVGTAAEFLVEQGIDSLYVFSDFEDFVDEEYCQVLGQHLGRSKVRTYVQPAAARTEHLWTVAKKVARRSRGRELPPLTEILRPQDKEDPLVVAVEKEVPVPEGVNFATPRQERDGKGVFYSYRSHRYHKEWYGEVLKVVEYPNFDIVLRGPEARAYIYMKTPEGFIQNPIIFGYHSYKPYLGTDDRWHTRKRKFLRHAEPPKFEDGEFSWKMILEDEILFEVLFWFKEDSATGTYIAERPPNGEGDGASIFFFVPPLARESKDRYYSVDFPEGLKLDDLRTAMTNNIADFYLPSRVKDRYETAWNRLGFKTGANPSRYNVIFRDLPHGVREVTVGGPSFGPRKLKARTTSNNLLLNTGNRADMELWEGFSCRLTRPSDRREGKRKTEAIEFSVE